MFLITLIYYFGFLGRSFGDQGTLVHFLTDRKVIYCLEKELSEEK